MCDNIVSVTAVTGSGKVVVADATQNAELLWALRGGGGGHIAVVTEFTLRTVDVSSGVTVFNATIPIAQGLQALAWFQRWQGTLPGGLQVAAPPHSRSHGPKSHLLPAHPPACLPADKFTMRAGYNDFVPPNNSTVIDMSGWCMGSLQECQAELRASLPTSGAMAGLRFDALHTDLVNATLAGIGWPAPKGMTPLQALASKTAWDRDRAYYK